MCPPPRVCHFAILNSDFFKRNKAKQIYLKALNFPLHLYLDVTTLLNVFFITIIYFLTFSKNIFIHKNIKYWLVCFKHQINSTKYVYLICYYSITYKCYINTNMYIIHNLFHLFCFIQYCFLRYIHITIIHLILKCMSISCRVLYTLILSTLFHMSHASTYYYHFPSFTDEEMEALRS